VLEAQACGTPVIVNSIGGSSEIVTSGRNGFIVDKFSQLEDILIDKSKKETMLLLKTNSRKLSLEKYDVNVVAAKYVDLYAKYN
jgi:glycosyltransferase involved in cell wall biosynthesis